MDVQNPYILEEGLHKLPVAGIAGTDKLSCPSLILSGGYMNEENRGDWFTYIGAGGRDLSSNKRTPKQSFDQKIDRSNAAIARNCSSTVLSAPSISLECLPCCLIISWPFSDHLLTIYRLSLPFLVSLELIGTL